MNPIEEEAGKRIGEAKEDRAIHEPWLRDAYRFFMPWRRRIGEARQRNDQDELFDSTGIEALWDFASDMQLTLTPPEQPWLSVEPAQTLNAADAGQVAGQIATYRDAVFAEILRSNFHEASQEAYADLALGTCSMCIQDVDPTAPIQCQAIPSTDLLIGRGVYGGVDFRCREIPAMKLRDLEPSYPGAEFPNDILGRIAKDPAGTVEVRECFWRVHDRRYDELWQFALLVDNKLVNMAMLEGSGSCSVIVSRWRTDSTTAWGIGPLYVVLPTAKSLDQLNYEALKSIAIANDPPGFYDQDGVLNLENGVGPGDWTPRLPGTKVEWLQSGADFKTTFFSQDKMEQAIKRAVFQNKPQQPGDTPATATQWNDQKAEIARRMGAPIGRLTTEWQYAVFQRFAWLLEKRGALPKVKLNGAEVRLRPQSPLILALRQQNVVTADRFLQTLVGAFGPQAVQMLVKLPETAAAMKKAAGADLVQLNTTDEIKAMLQQAAQVAQPQGSAQPAAIQQPGTP